MNEDEKIIIDDILRKASRPQGLTIKNPYSKDYMEIIGANLYLKENKQKVPKLFKELEKQMWQKTKNWKI